MDVSGESMSVQTDSLVQESGKGYASDLAENDSFAVEFEVHWLVEALLKPFAVILKWIRHHLTLTLSGDSPHVKVSFSPIVAFSSLLYLAVAYAYLMQQCYVTMAMFMGITITSLFSDSIQPNSKTWCCLDRSLATLGAFFGPIRAIVFYANGPVQQLQIMALSFFSVSFLAWSRKSKSQNDFVLRHTCWHAVSSACLVWLALNCPPMN